MHNAESLANGPARIVQPLRIYRVAHGLSQAELAERAGISRMQLGNLELGKHRPHRLTASALADILGVEVGALFPPEGGAVR